MQYFLPSYRYLEDLKKVKDGVSGSMGKYVPQPVPPLKQIPLADWFRNKYAKDVLSRLPQIRDQLSSVHGKILKMDSTKAVVKKLGGHAHGTASWATLVGNEHGQVLTCVLTASESYDELKLMADGLVKRYKDHGQPEPQVMYVDRWCCAKGPPKTGENEEIECCDSIDSGETFYHRLFSGWPSMKIRLDALHFMMRVANFCLGTSHPLHADFMSCLLLTVF